MKVQPPETDPKAPGNLAGGVPAAEGQFILERRARLVRPLFRRPAGHLVDFGCGNGAQTLSFTGDFDRLTGVDVSEDFLEDFRREIMPAACRTRSKPWSPREVPFPCPTAWPTW